MSEKTKITPEAISDKTIRIIQEEMLCINSISLTHLKPTNTFKQFDLDSLDVLEIVIRLEQEFNILLPDEEVNECVSLGDLINLVERKVEVNQ